MEDFYQRQNQNAVLRAISGDSTSPVYSDALREFRPEDGWRISEAPEPTGRSSLAFLLAAAMFTVAAILLW